MPKYTVYVEVTKTIKIVGLTADSKQDAVDTILDLGWDEDVSILGDVVCIDTTVTKVKEE